MASVNRELLVPYMEAYRSYLDAQERDDNVGPFSNVQEEYKRDIAKKAAAIIASDSWQESYIGSGLIGDQVIKAVQRNVNLVGRFQITAFSDKVKEDYSASEQILYVLFHDHKGEDVFEAICKIFGRKYDLVSYLYFVHDPNRYLPLRSSIFDDIFKKLGIDLRTSGRCSWNNYLEYLTTIAAVRDLMKDYYQVDDIDLLDAHSFLWTLNPDGVDLKPKEESIANTNEDSIKEKKAEVGTAVFHKEYGKGTISKITEENIYIEFGCGLRLFPYPDAIEKGWLTFELYQ